MKTLIMTVGLPQSGKSTWARSQAHPIVNPDSIRLALHGKPFIGLAEPFVWAIAEVVVRALFLADHDTVILDATNTTHKRRDAWKSEDWIREYQEFDESIHVCGQRAQQTCDPEYLEGLLSVIDSMYEKFETVGNDEREDGRYLSGFLI